jgi:plastocyanin
MAAAVACGGDEDPTGPNDPGDGGGGGGGGGSGRVVTTAVNVGPGESFSPAHIQVTPGAIVTWTFVEGPHNVTFPSPTIDDSGDQSSGSFTAGMPTTPGTYNYSCTLHSGMSGSVLVQ